jgi:hypothetical protein
MGEWENGRIRGREWVIVGWEEMNGMNESDRGWE